MTDFIISANRKTDKMIQEKRKETQAMENNELSLENLEEVNGGFSDINPFFTGLLISRLLSLSRFLSPAS